MFQNVFFPQLKVRVNVFGLESDLIFQKTDHHLFWSLTL